MEHEQHPPTGPTFDTLKAAEALQQAGFTSAQARAVTQTIVDAQANLASKADIKDLQTATEAGFKELRAEFKAEFEKLRVDSRRMEETLRADFKAEFERQRADFKAEFERQRADNAQLREKVSSNRTLILSVGVPVLLIAVGQLFAG